MLGPLALSSECLVCVCSWWGLLLSLDGGAVNESATNDGVVNGSVAIYPKGIPINLEGSKKKNERSLFS